jgi:poly-gamma-glutamate synthesis protein (capsule biosynthesis protein)
MNQADMADKAWEERTALAILSFEDLTPRWKVLAVDGVTPYDQEFDAADYGLSFYFGLQSAAPPPQVTSAG